MFWKTIDRLIAWRKRYAKIASCGINLVSDFQTLLQNPVTYAYLVYNVVNNGMSISAFVFYFSIITGFSGWLGGVLNSFAGTIQNSRSFCDLRFFSLFRTDMTE